MTAAAQKYAPWLWLLSVLFLFRVVAQPLALVFGSGFLPAFESWHGGVLPYPLLLASQILILLWLAHTARRFSAGAVVPRRRVGVPVLVFAAVYFAAMLLRLILGATMLSGQRWFASPLPTVFHLVLAGFLLLYGYFHYRYGIGERHDSASE